MTNKHSSATFWAVVCTLLPFSTMTAVATEAPQSLAQASSWNQVVAPAQNGAEDAAESARKIPPVVIMADDPEYQRFVEQYRTQSPATATALPAVNPSDTAERTLILKQSASVTQTRNKGQLFIFQNITQPAVPQKNPDAPLMEFRRNQIEQLKHMAAGKKAQ